MSVFFIVCPWCDTSDDYSTILDSTGNYQQECTNCEKTFGFHYTEPEIDDIHKIEADEENEE